MESDESRKIEVHLSPELTDQIRKAFDRPKREGRFTLDGVTKLIQFLTLTGGGLGALFFFVDDCHMKHAQLEAQQQQVALNMLDLENKSGVHITPDSLMTISRLDEPGTYALRFSLKIPNKGVVPMRVFRNDLALYVGKPRGADSDAGAEFIYPPEDPRGPVQWSVPPRVYLTFDDVVGGGNTGLIRPGEATYGVYDFVVRLAPRDWVAVRARYGVDDDAVDGGVTRNESLLEYCALGGPRVWACAIDEKTADAGAGEAGGRK